MSRNLQQRVFESSSFADSKLLTLFQRKSLIKNLEECLHPEYRRRIEIMLLADMGKSQSQICRKLYQLKKRMRQMVVYYQR